MRAPPPPPDARELLPPLLACLPTSFISPRPPPALLPLLSPVLRQRLNYLSADGSSGARDGWLPLLTWSQQTASTLPDVVERIQIEPHPVSGEIELDDIPSPKYRRLDEETLHARLTVAQFGLAPIYLWCENDEHGGTGAGWKLADLRTMEDDGHDSIWHESLTGADQSASALPGSSFSLTQSNVAGATSSTQQTDDDDDYWAAYDQTPSQTPAQAPQASRRTPQNGINRNRSQSELDYFARYGDVQPAMDAHDPDEAPIGSTTGPSTLQGNTILADSARFPPTLADIHEPRPIATQSQQSAVPGTTTGESAQPGSAQESDNSAQVGVKQHISTDMKSLYRLAKSVGISRDEFTDLINRELEVLSIYDQDD